MRLVGLAIICLVSAPAVAHADARFRFAPSGGGLIGMSNLSPSPGCVSGRTTATVIELRDENGAVKGMGYKDAKGQTSSVNVPALYNFKSDAEKAKVADGYRTLIRVGHVLDLGIKSCGAAGRIEKLDSIALVSGAAGGDTARPASTAAAITASAAPSKWLLTQPTKVQHSLAISSTDRAFSLSLSCMRNAKGNIGYSTFLLGRRGWSPVNWTSAISIDGALTKWELDGADSGLVLSDTTEENTVTLSSGARNQLAKGQRLVVAGGKGRPRDAVFDLSGGEAAFAAFEAKCQALPRS